MLAVRRRLLPTHLHARTRRPACRYVIYRTDIDDTATAAGRRRLDSSVKGVIVNHPSSLRQKQSCHTHMTHAHKQTGTIHIRFCASKFAMRTATTTTLLGRRLRGDGVHIFRFRALVINNAHAARPTRPPVFAHFGTHAQRGARYGWCGCG